MQTITVV